MNQAFTVPEGCVFVCGDNRNHSSDSRVAQLGMVDERYVIGRVLMVFFPLCGFLAWCGNRPQGGAHLGRVLPPIELSLISTRPDGTFLPGLMTIPIERGGVGYALPNR